MTYITLFLEFFKTGLFAIGGGLATLPFLYEMAEKYPWFDESMLADMIAVSESTPGPIGINMATYAGYEAVGILGGLIATIALVMPSVIIIVLVAQFLTKFQNSKTVQSAFYGLRPIVTGLIAASGFEVVKITILDIDQFQATKQLTSLFQVEALVLFVLLVVGVQKTKLHPIAFVVLGAIVGIVFKM